MPTPPDAAAVKAYLGGNNRWNDDEITVALAAETAAQARVVRFPADPEPPAPALDYPDDLAEALCRRVAHLLAVRALPLGVQANITDSAVAVSRVGGSDPEVRRLEAPWRKLVKG